MQVKSIEKKLTRLNGAEASYPFGPDALVYKVKGKMFALVSQNKLVPRLTLKCTPTDAEILVSQYDSITPGYHMNKRHWITISLTDELSQGLITELINNSYTLVVGKLSKVVRATLV